MEYTVKKLASLAGISTRTLRYYDEIGILKPARINSSGYRIYGQEEVGRLQQIMFYRELDVSLDSIKDIIISSDFDGTKALKGHREKLLQKRKQLDELIDNVEKTIESSEGRLKMSDKERFNGFKRKLVEENERKYGEEIREKYGKESVEKSNQKVLDMTEEAYEEVTKLEKEIRLALVEAMKVGEPASDLAQKAADLHRQWLTFYWSEYRKEAHAGLAQMYVDDERFKVHYEKAQPGATEFLRDAIWIYTGRK